jgi:hypothetical protein
VMYSVAGKEVRVLEWANLKQIEKDCSRTGRNSSRARGMWNYPP